jgi:hypothetical protein
MNRRNLVLMFCLLVVLPMGIVFTVLVWGHTNVAPYMPVDIQALGNINLDQRDAKLSDVPQRFRDLEGQRVKLEGGMWAPTARQLGVGVGSFQLISPSFMHDHHRAPLAQWFISAAVKPGATIYYSDQPVEVYGVFHVHLVRDDTGMLKSVYSIDVDNVAPPTQPVSANSDREASLNQAMALAGCSIGAFLIMVAYLEGRRRRRVELIGF